MSERGQLSAEERTSIPATDRPSRTAYLAALGVIALHWCYQLYSADQHRVAPESFYAMVTAALTYDMRNRYTGG